MDILILEKLNEIADNLINMLTDEWMNIKETCKYASISDSKIRRAVKKGVLKASQSTERLLFKKSNVDKWLGGK